MKAAVRFVLATCAIFAHIALSQEVGKVLDTDTTPYRSSDLKTWIAPLEALIAQAGYKCPAISKISSAGEGVFGKQYLVHCDEGRGPILFMISFGPGQNDVAIEPQTEEGYEKAPSLKAQTGPEPAIEMVNGMRFDDRVHVDSIPTGAMVIYFPRKDSDAAGEPQVLGETPLVISEAALKPGKLFIAFQTKTVISQLSQVPELNDQISEFAREMRDRRTSFAESSYAAIFHSSRYFKFPTNATRAIVTKAGELLAFGPVFDYGDEGLIWNRFVAWALPNGKPASALFSFMPDEGTYVAANSGSSIFEMIPKEKWPEAQGSISRCGYYGWVGAGKTQSQYVALTAQIMAAGELSMINRVSSPGR